MYKNLIINYAKNMTMEDVNNYIKNNKINVSERDKLTIYNHIKEYYSVFFDDPLKYIQMLKSNISDNTYYNILKIYDKYKDKL